ncbi:type III polyketide synthase [Anaerolineales bacterium HSG25]|nr:type III polyketide synthase [Anaerolineales bacterium HSG25]
MTNYTSRLTALATQLPPHQHEQMALHDCWLAPFINSHRARAIFAASEIETRYSVFADATFLTDEPSAKKRNDLYLALARPLAVQLTTRLLKQANLAPTDIDHIILVSCTGFDTPGLEMALAAELGMKPTLRRSALIGMGCHAGLTAFDRAMLELSARPDSRVLVLAVELCMIHFQHGGKLDNMIASAIFADGLGGAIIERRDPASLSEGKSPHVRYPKLLETMSYNFYQTPNFMGVHLSDTGFQISLSTKVAKLLRREIRGIIDLFLEQIQLSQTDIRFWGIHPGGARIIDYVGEALGLTESELQYARTVLRQYGNMSSATIFFVLDEIVNHGQPHVGDYGLLMTFGPGLTVECCLVQW